LPQPINKNKPIVLIVDDEYRIFRTIPRLISAEVFSTIWAPDEHQGLEVLKDKKAKVRIIVIDLKSSGMGGGGFLHHARKIAPQAAILITGPLGPFLYQEGTFYDFLGPNLKENINTILLGILQRMGIDQVAKEDKNFKGERKQRFGVIIGRSRSINAIYRLIENLETSYSTVLIQGESGTGKELIARTVHQNSPRKNHSFVAINCGAIPANLMESELFGHERGAFTTAVNVREGKFQIAQGGTLFLDEIGELDKGLQVKLLRVLQEKEFQRVGGNRTYKTDVRIIAATSQDLKISVQDGHFRDDLYYRLNVVPIHIPPLRERREDIPLLLDHFFETIGNGMGRSQPLLTEAAHKALLDYSYPGNVRELTNIVERLFVTCPNGKITLQDLPDEVCEEAEPLPASPELLKVLPDDGARLQEVEKELILKTLAKTSGNKVAAARMLGITRRRLYLRLSQYGEVSA
jgi:two-component system response regulator PilR (NtrC family)